MEEPADDGTMISHSWNARTLVAALATVDAFFLVYVAIMVARGWS